MTFFFVIPHYGESVALTTQLAHLDRHARFDDYVPGAIFLPSAPALLHHCLGGADDGVFIRAA